jgi:hypothetical protein
MVQTIDNAYFEFPCYNILHIFLQDLLWLEDKKDNIEDETKHASILSFATLIYKTCSVKCSVDVVDKYTRIFLDRLTGKIVIIKSKI